MARYRLTPDDASNVTRIVVRLAGKAGRVLALYDNGREKFYTYSGGKEF